MDIISNKDLTIPELFRKRDLITGLINLGYNLYPELEHVKEALKMKLHEDYKHAK